MVCRTLASNDVMAITKRSISGSEKSGPAGAGLGHDRCERSLADLKRIAPQVVAVQFNEVEGVEEYALVSALVPDEIERGNAVVIAGDNFTVDDAGARA